MSIKEDSIIGTLLKILKERPDFILMLLVVGGFLYYMDLKDQRAADVAEREAARADFVAEQRITACHDMQHKATEAMDRNTAALILHSEKDARLAEEIDTLTITVSGHTNAIHSMEMSVQQLIEMVSQHERLNYLNYDSSH